MENINGAQPEFTNTPNVDQTGQTQKSLDETLAAHREQWVKDITELNEMMKNLPKLDELMNIVYSTRQKAVDYYFGMNNVILNRTKLYKKRYSDMFNSIKINGLNGMRFTTDQSISRVVEAELGQEKEMIDILTNHNKYMESTIETIDNIIYGINQKIKIHEILNGLKF